MASSRPFGADDPVAAWLTFGVGARRQRGARGADQGSQHALRRGSAAPAKLSRARVPACGYTTVARLLDPSSPAMLARSLRAA